MDLTNIFQQKGKELKDIQQNIIDFIAIIEQILNFYKESIRMNFSDSTIFEWQCQNAL